MGRVLNFKIPIYDDVAVEDIWLSEYGVWVASAEGIKLSVLPSQTINTTKVIGQTGESFLSANYESRQLPLGMYIEDIDALDSVKKLFMSNKPKWFHFKNTNTKIKAIVTGEILVRPFGRQGVFDLVLTCPDPYFYESFPVTREFTNPTQIRFWNDGNDFSYPLYEVTGKGIVNIGVNGVVMTLSLDTANYETLIIDTRAKEVRKGDSENRFFSNTSYKFPTMVNGENLVAVTGNCTKIKIIPNSRWL